MYAAGSLDVLQASQASQASQAAQATLVQQSQQLVVPENVTALSFGGRDISIVDSAMFFAGNELPRSVQNVFTPDHAGQILEHFCAMDKGADPSWMFAGVGWHGTPREAGWKHLKHFESMQYTNEVLLLAKECEVVLAQHIMVHYADTSATNWTALALATLLKYCRMVRDKEVPCIPALLWLHIQGLGWETRIPKKALHECMEQAIGHVREFLVKLGLMADSRETVWDMLEELPAEQNRRLLAKYEAPGTSSLSWDMWKLLYLDGTMPEELLQELMADQLPRCDRIWFDPHGPVRDDRSQQILWAFRQSHTRTAKLARATKLDGSYWVSSRNDMALVIDAAIPHPLCTKNPERALRNHASVKAFCLPISPDPLDGIKAQGRFSVWHLGPEGAAFKIGHYTLVSFLSFKASAGIPLSES